MFPPLQAVVNELGGEPIIGRRVTREDDMRDAIRQGFAPEAVQRLMNASGLTMKEIAAALDLSPRTLNRRKRHGRLAAFESDRLYRLARTLALATEFIGDRERALRWLKQPNSALSGAAPFQALDTELGARQVENLMGRIAYGGVS